MGMGVGGMGVCFSRERGCLAVSSHFGWAGFGSLTAAKEIAGALGKSQHMRLRTIYGSFWKPCPEIGLPLRLCPMEKEVGGTISYNYEGD